MHHGLPARFAWPVGKEGRMLTYRGIIGKREIGEKTGNGWENGKPVEGGLYVRFQFYCRGLAPRTPLRRGVRSAPLRFAAGSPHGRRMVGTWSPHGRRMVSTWSPHDCRMIAAWSPHGQDGALYNFCSICYTSDKERNLARHPNNCQFFIWQTFLSLYCSINVVVCSPRRQDGALYNFCSICYNSGTERKREREKEKLSKSKRSLAGGKPPVAGGNPHAHLNGTVAHAGLPAPLHPATELSHASTELCDTLACRHLRSIDTVYVHI